MSNDQGNATYQRLLVEAERARWQLHALDWQRLDRSLVTPALIAIVREAVYSEMTTFSGAQRFFLDFEDDVDFTAWITLWLYEETKHPQVLIEWLRQVDVHFDQAELLAARRTHPFMKSRTGTLLVNMISEMLASATYLQLAKVKEPLLAEIGRRLAGDEARHASGFYTYAAKRIATAEDPDAERIDALKSLYVWMMHYPRTQHPVGLFYDKMSASEASLGVAAPLLADVAAVRRRAMAMVGTLVGHSIEDNAGIVRTMRELSARSGARQRIASDAAG